MPSHTSTRSVTLRDVAEAAGVNPSTVSRAMRGDPRLRPETREHVKTVARELRYRPNPYVTAFATHVRNHRQSPHSATVAVLDTYEDDTAAQGGWALRYAQGLADRAADHGFGVDTLRLRDHADGGLGIAKVVEARGIRGLVVMPVRGLTVLTGLDFRSLAAATIDLSLRHPSLHRASPDYFQGIQLALDSLHAHRYRRIGFCSYRGEVRRIGSRWLGGYLAWQFEGPAEERLAPHINPHEDPSDGAPVDADAYWRKCRDDFARWLEQERPDAIVSNDLFFQGWLQELGHRVPGDVAFAALGIAPGTMRCSGIDQRTEHVGAAAMDLVIGQIYRNEYGVPPIARTVLVPAAWIDGETTA